MTEDDKPKCEHEWVYSTQVLMSNPPVYQKICKACGLKQQERGQHINYLETYEAVEKRFKLKEKE